jgi:hypothetical protein
MKYLHICDSEKFISPFIDFINLNFNKEEHFFIVIKNNKYDIKDEMNVRKIENVKNNLKYIKHMMNSSENIYFHSLINDHIVYFLFFNSRYLRKSNWIIWGSDLYRYLYRNDNIKNRIKELIRKKVIKKMKGVITHIKGDYNLAQEWYGVKGVYYYCFMYPSNLYNTYNIEQNKNNKNRIYILIGNSSDPSNNHLEIFAKLEMYKDKNIEIICPLSYGSSVYRDIVISKGRKLFGDKFKPLTDFMPFTEYLCLLSKVDIAVFNHKRQQAMGNITTLLGLGKKVYVRDDITTWNFFLDHDLKVYNSNGNLEDLFDLIDENIRTKNIENVKIKFSEEVLIKDWRKIFNDGVDVDE